MIPNKFLCSVALCALLLSAQNMPRFPQANLVSVKAAPDHLLGKSFMPGGALATYKKGKVEWTLFAAQCPNPVDAAIRLPDWRKALKDARFEASFGGYFGLDAGVPVFVFAKSAWIAGVKGLPEKEADAQARLLAARL